MTADLASTLREIEAQIRDAALLSVLLAQFQSALQLHEAPVPEWLELELSGYSDVDEHDLPDYRNLQVQWVGAAFDGMALRKEMLLSTEALDPRFREVADRMPVRNPLHDIENTLQTTTGSSLYRDCPDLLRDAFQSGHPSHRLLSVRIRFPRASYASIISSVRNRLITQLSTTQRALQASEGHLEAGNPAMDQSDRYEVHKQLGSGGCARVYLATDRKLKRYVALKFLDDAVLDMLDPLNEPRVLASLRHPNIVVAYDVCPVTDPHSGRPAECIILEHLDGVTLSQRLKTTIPAADALRFSSSILAAVKYIHENKLFHGDLHPDNIIVTTDRPVLIDVLYNDSVSRFATLQIKNRQELDVGAAFYAVSEILRQSDADLAAIMEFQAAARSVREIDALVDRFATVQAALGSQANARTASQGVRRESAEEPRTVDPIATLKTISLEALYVLRNYAVKVLHHDNLKKLDTAHQMQTLIEQACLHRDADLAVVPTRHGLTVLEIARKDADHGLDTESHPSISLQAVNGSESPGEFRRNFTVKNIGVTIARDIRILAVAYVLGDISKCIHSGVTEIEHLEPGHTHDYTLFIRAPVREHGLLADISILYSRPNRLKFIDTYSVRRPVGHSGDVQLSRKP